MRSNRRMKDSSSQKIPGSQKKLSMIDKNNPGISLFFTPFGEVPTCNHNLCTHCYYKAAYKWIDIAKYPVVESTDIIKIAKQLKSSGYNNIFFPITSELLLAPNWKEIVDILNHGYINTNGIIIAERGCEILDEIAEVGIKGIVITANITKSPEILNLTPKEIIEVAFDEIRKYNLRNPERAFETTATVTVTAENYNKIFEMCDYVYTVYKADRVRFLTVIPTSHDLCDLVASLDELSVATHQIIQARKKYSKDDFYIQRDGPIGSQYLKPEKLKGYCVAGDEFSIISLKDNSPVNPCIFIPGLPIGKILKGEVIIDRQKRALFKWIKATAIKIGCCPAYAIATIRFAPEKLPDSEEKQRIIEAIKIFEKTM